MTELDANSSVLGWERVSKAYFNVDVAQSSADACAPFLYHVNELHARVQSKLKRTGGLKVAMGKKLEFEIHTIARPSTEAIKNPLGEIVLDLSHPAASFVSSRRVRADSSRDIKTVGVITTPLFSAADGHISIRTCVFKPKASSADSAAPSAVTPATAPATATPPAAMPTLNQDMLSADKRNEIIVARYDFPLRVGGYRPWLASAMIAAAAAISVYKVSAQGQFTKLDLVVPGLVWLLTFFGLSFGIIKK